MRRYLLAITLVLATAALYFAPNQPPETDHYKRVVSEGIVGDKND